ncbi:hypothetical protein IMZ48_18415 [Candidatus Bathyarchaeota archaeon]|nr:hypothetical protein [Candidatus Bathyarchaeota archaeon]
MALTVETALVLLLSEAEKAEFFVAIDGASELVSETTPSKLGTVLIVDCIPGVLRVLGEELNDGSLGSNLLLVVVGGVSEAMALGVTLGRGA